ncbi:hypothetical protein CLM85_12890 [Streptomyces albidoflavus]|nr:hypothetical protein CLM83_01075 [Streptomyces albidoflavus]PBO24003.1 hypothetical protein CLM85_12890 [Streptomyces albidoflavus]PBO26512.1 hypothetical protein CLM84_31455 [Streptomyces albidoflavus]
MGCGEGMLAHCVIQAGAVEQRGVAGRVVQGAAGVEEEEEAVGDQLDGIGVACADRADDGGGGARPVQARDLHGRHDSGVSAGAVVVARCLLALPVADAPLVDLGDCGKGPTIACTSVL